MSDMPAANDNFQQAANDNTAQDSTEPARKTASAGDVSTETTGDHRASYPPEPGEASPAKAEATAQKVPGNDTATQTDASQITNSAGSPESAAPKFNAAEGDQPRFASASDTSPVAMQYDPAFEKRAMGSDFKSGVYDPSGLMREKETAIADRLAAERSEERRVG